MLAAIGVTWASAFLTAGEAWWFNLDGSALLGNAATAAAADGIVLDDPYYVRNQSSLLRIDGASPPTSVFTLDFSKILDNLVRLTFAQWQAQSGRHTPLPWWVLRGLAAYQAWVGQQDRGAVRALRRAWGSSADALSLGLWARVGSTRPCVSLAGHLQGSGYAADALYDTDTGAPWAPRG